MTQHNSTEFHSDMVFQERENDLIIPPFGVNRKQPFVFRDPEEFSSFEFSVGEFLGQSWWHLAKQLIRRGTLPETNIAPEHQWLEDDFLLGKTKPLYKSRFFKMSIIILEPLRFLNVTPSSVFSLWPSIIPSKTSSLWRRWGSHTHLIPPQKSHQTKLSCT